jgi:hypothetical protein
VVLTPLYPGYVSFSLTSHGDRILLVTFWHHNWDIVAPDRVYLVNVPFCGYISGRCKNHRDPFRVSVMYPFFFFYIPFFRERYLDEISSPHREVFPVKTSLTAWTFCAYAHNNAVITGCQDFPGGLKAGASTRQGFTSPIRTFFR